MSGEFSGKTVEVIVLPVEPNAPLPPEMDSHLKPYLMPRPVLTEAERIRFEANPYPLRGKVIEYIDPFEPVVPPEDWEASQGEKEDASDDSA